MSKIKPRAKIPKEAELDEVIAVSYTHLTLPTSR